MLRPITFEGMLKQYAGGPLDFEPGSRYSYSNTGYILLGGVVEKVILRFSDHWWPTPRSGYFRWYDTPASWCEWVDLSDGCGAPVVAGLIAGEAVGRHHHGRTDEEVAHAAAHALSDWADAVERGESSSQ